ncbi:hypothetical protein M427DRAFT_29151 [Gonapodya prolifera JEL478]|uniref:t-SNARE coiled-coil homology domain-containing protein n=1 Tax=Gonapodya prolifera (strain JEL478) TaxID=1344416 RepID=A0A139ARS1_GONPJ|nr:hypothetical protein M427DRAFT_29151 [Gonapodya prolifera JEL478]|eukprot:KXS19175.1 hypothetical protein M427DRAFT_29151 [Gonapodya prolifera JEL478]
MSFFGFGKRKDKDERPQPTPGDDRRRPAEYDSPPPRRGAAPSADLDYQRQQLMSGSSAGQGQGRRYEYEEGDTVETLQQKTLGLQGETTQSSQRGLQNIYRIQDMGMQAMSTLEKNQQQLDRIEGRLGEAFDQSHRAQIHTRDLEKLNRPFFVPAGKMQGDNIQDTTFRGSSRNGFLDESAEAKKRAADEKRRAKLAALGADVEETRGRYGDRMDSARQRQYEGDGSYDSRREWEQQEQASNLDAIAAALPGIKQMAMGIGESIDSQNVQLGRLAVAAQTTSGKVQASGKKLDKIIG